MEHVRVEEATKEEIEQVLLETIWCRFDNWINCFNYNDFFHWLP